MIIRDEARRLILVSALYAALTFVMAYPFSASPGSLVLADLPDTHLFIWTLAWDTHAFLHQPLLIFDANIYHPYPNTLAYSENLIGTAFFAAPIIWLTGNLVLAMNLAALLTCVLCGVGAYLLARRWGLSPAAAFICGVIFAFAPPRFFRLGQLHMTAVQWMPFSLAFLHSYFEHGRRRDLLLAIACFSLQVLSSGHGAAFLAVAILLLFAWRTAFGQRLAIRQRLKDCGATGAYLLAPSIWVVVPYRAAQVDAGLRREYPEDSMPRLADFLASPSRFHEYLQGIVLGRTINEDAVAFLFPGILAILLAGLAIMTWRPIRARLRADLTGYFALLALVSTLMFVTWPIETWRYVHWLPGFNFIRVPSRFILLLMLCLAMLGAAGFDRLTVRLSTRARAIAAAVLATFLLAEYSSYPFAGVPYTLEIPAIDRWLNTLPKPFTIAEVPVPSAERLGQYERHHTAAMLHATAHWQKTVHGYSGIRRPLHDELYMKLTDFPEPDTIDALREVGVTHVVVHTDRYPGDEWQGVESRLARSPDLGLLHSEGAGRVYAVRPR
ncbi:MAG: hypothetical protein WD690_20355 [Vicinamibacterales bacterium]